MTDLVALDRAKYEELAAVDAYRKHSPGEEFAPIFCDIVGDQRGTTLLDAGCCTGKGGLALAAKGFRVTLCDYTDAYLTPEAKVFKFQKVRTLWDIKNYSIYNYVYCCDVLEHIPREFTMLTIDSLRSSATDGAFFSVSLVPDNFGAWVGKPLHETVEPFVWWRDRMKEFGYLQEARDLGTVGLYYVVPL